MTKGTTDFVESPHQVLWTKPCPNFSESVAAIQFCTRTSFSKTVGNFSVLTLNVLSLCYFQWNVGFCRTWHSLSIYNLCSVSWFLETSLCNKIVPNSNCGCLWPTGCSWIRGWTGDPPGLTVRNWMLHQGVGVIGIFYCWLLLIL